MTNQKIQFYTCVRLEKTLLRVKWGPLLLFFSCKPIVLTRHKALDILGMDSIFMALNLKYLFLLSVPSLCLLQLKAQVPK